MKALLKLVETFEDVKRVIRLCDGRGVRILHKKYGGPPHDLCLNDHLSSTGELETYFSFNHGGYGSSINVRPGPTLPNSWRLEGAAAQVPNHKQLTGLAVCFVGTTWSRDLEEQRNLVTRRGGRLVNKPSRKVDVLVVGGGANQEATAVAHPGALVVSEQTFQRVLPRPRSTKRSPQTPVVRMGGDARSLFKLLSARDLEHVDQGLFLARSLEDSAVLDDLLSDVGVDPHGALDRGRRFTGTGPHQPFLDHALMGLLSLCAPKSEGARTRASIVSISLEEALTAPVIQGFTGLESLSIQMAEGAFMADLTSCGSLPSLRSLSVQGASGHTGRGDQKLLLSLEGLVAPALEELLVARTQIPDLEPVRGCHQLTKVDLEDCISLTSIDPLSDASGLTWISLRGCRKISTVAALEGASGLTYCDLYNLGDVGDLEALAGKPELSRLGLAYCRFASTRPLADTRDWSVIGTYLGEDEVLSLHLSGAPFEDYMSELYPAGPGDLSGLCGLSREVKSLDVEVPGSGRETDSLAAVPVQLRFHPDGAQVLDVFDLSVSSDVLDAIKEAEEDYAAYDSVPREERVEVIRERRVGCRWEEAALMGSGKACFLLAKIGEVEGKWIRRPGRPAVPADNPTVRRWYHRGAHLGDGFCQGNYGNTLGKSRLSRYWHRLAAAQGVPSAQFNHCANLLEGRLPEDLEEAHYWALQVSRTSLAELGESLLETAVTRRTAELGTVPPEPTDAVLDGLLVDLEETRPLEVEDIRVDLAPGDVILAVDGETLKGRSAHEIEERLAGGFGSRASVKVRRSDGSTQQVEVVRRWLAGGQRGGELMFMADLSSLPLLEGVTDLKLDHGTLGSLSGLSNLPNLRNLTLENTPLRVLDIPPMAHLKKVHLSGCTSLRNVEALSQQPGDLFVLLDGCVALESTRGLESATNLLISNCPEIRSLEGLADSPGVLTAEDGWSDGEPRPRSTMSLEGSPCLDATVPSQWRWFSAVKPLLDLSGCRRLTDLGGLGPTERPGIPAVLLQDCTGLRSLAGLEVFTDLCFLDLRGCHALEDVGPLKERDAPLCVVVSAEWPNGPDGVDRDVVSEGPRLCTSLMGALAALPSLFLVVVYDVFENTRDAPGISVSASARGLEALRGMTGLRGLDLVQEKWGRSLVAVENTPLRTPDLAPLVELEGLRVLRLPEGCLPPRCGPIAKGTNKSGSIKNLRKAVAKSLGIKMAAAKTRPAPKGLRSLVSKLRKLLTQPSFASIQQGLELLHGAGVPQAWDALLAELQPSSALISGESSEDMVGMGTVFRRGKFKEAIYARWATLCLLATAPDEALEAVKLRERIRTIRLDTSEGLDGSRLESPLPVPPSLKGFTGLTTLEVFGALDGEGLDWLEVPSLRTLWLLLVPNVTDLGGLAGAAELTHIALGAPALESLRGCEVLARLQHVALNMPALTSLSPLAGATDLRSLRLSECTALTSLTGVDNATGLSAVSGHKCPALVDLGALSDKGALTTTLSPAPKTASNSGWTLDRYWTGAMGPSLSDTGFLDLGTVGRLSDVAFLGAQEDVVTLSLQVAKGVDLSPLSRLPRLTKVSLSLPPGGASLSGLERVKILSLMGDGAPSEVSPMPNLESLNLYGEATSLAAPWPELPSLTKVKVNSDKVTSLGWLNAPALEEVDVMEAHLEDCAGFGHTGALKLPRYRWGKPTHPVVVSFRGMEGNGRVRGLDLRTLAVDADLSVLSTFTSLEAIDAGTNRAIESLKETSTVTWLAMRQYEGGSLAFLEGWSALRHLILVNSGVFTDLEALEGLKNLETIHLRYSETKRRQWPESLQDKLDFTSATHTYGSPVD